MALTIAEIKDALSETNGNISAAARYLGVERQSVYERIWKNEGLQKHLEQQRERRVDKAESGLDAALDRGEAWAISLTLKTLGKDRGYVEKTEQQTSGDLTIRIVDDE